MGLTDFVETADFFFQAEDGIRDLVRSRGLGDVYKRQGLHLSRWQLPEGGKLVRRSGHGRESVDLVRRLVPVSYTHLTLPTIYSV